MNDEKYYDNTENSSPSKNVKYFINLNINPSKAIDLGCGAGKDTVFLIKNGWHVISIDANDTRERIQKKLNEEELSRFEFKQQKFEGLKLSKCDLIVANNSLSFCNPQEFDKMWKEITSNIGDRGYFVGNFFGIHDEWKGLKKSMTFWTKEQVLEYIYI